MSKRHTQCRVRVRKYKRFKGYTDKARWWMDCSCGYFQGYFNKQDALDCKARHLAEAAK